MKERPESLLFLITNITETGIKTIALSMGFKINSVNNCRFQVMTLSLIFEQIQYRKFYFNGVENTKFL